MVKQRRLKQTQITCTRKGCTKCYICKKKFERLHPETLNPTKTTETKTKKQGKLKCSFEGCVGCLVCKAASRGTQPHPKEEEEARVSNEEPTGLITPGKTYADALIASSTKKKVSILPGFAAAGEDQKSSTSPSCKSKDTKINLEEKFGPSNMEPLKNRKNTRWTGEERKEVVWCYFLGKMKNLPKIKGTYSLWRKRNPDNRLNINEVKLNNQLNYFLNKLSKDELREIEISVNAPNISKTSKEKEKEKEKEKVSSSEENEESNSELSKLVDKYKMEIVVKYKETLTIKLMDRLIPNKLRYCKQNKDKVDAANEVSTHIAWCKQ